MHVPSMYMYMYYNVHLLNSVLAYVPPYMYMYIYMYMYMPTCMYSTYMYNYACTNYGNIPVPIQVYTLV